MSDPVTETPAAEDSLQRLVDEQAALRRVATLVARESSPVEIFGAVTEEACRVMASEAVGLLRFDPDETAILVAQSDTPWDPPPLGTRFTLDGENVVTQVFRTGQTVRVDDWTDSSGAVAAMASVLGVRSAVASPVVVEGHLWGTIIAATSQDEPLPATTESRLVQFTALVSTAIANAGARGQLSRLAEEQAALRRVAVLVAQQPSPLEVFTAVTEAVGPLLGADLAAMHVFRGDGVATVVASWTQAGATLPIGTELSPDDDTAVGRIFHTRRAARIDTYVDVEGETAEVARDLRLRSTVGAPILIQGKLWGALMAATRSDDPLPEDAEARIAAFTELVATAVSNAQAREQVQRLADEQAALRRVATLVAQQPSPEEIFAMVAEAVGSLLGADVAAMVLFPEDDDAATVVASWSREGPEIPVGTPVPLDSDSAVARIFHSGAAARVDGYAPGAGAEIARSLGVRSTVGAPILVGGKLWGALAAAMRREEQLPDDAEARMAAFTELVATAVSNAQARGDLQRLAEEQAALRRVATLVAEDAPPAELFRAAAVEVGTLLGADFSGLARLEDGAVVPLAGWAAEGQHPPLPERWPMQPGDPVTAIAEGKCAVRWDSWAGIAGPIAAFIRNELGVRSTVGTPIVVEGRIWGVLAVHSRKPLPQGSQSRMEQFSNLVATAIGNAEARGEVARLANEQAGLRRVATLVAEGAAPADLFAAVAAEAAAVLGVSSASISRFLSDGVSVVLASLNDPGFPIGSRWQPDEGTLNAIILDTRRPVRIDQSTMSGPIAEASQVSDVGSVVGAPIMVEGDVWGMVAVGRQHSDEPLPADTEARLTDFTELVATSISNTEARDSERRLAEEQAALRRVAEVVAREASPGEVFTAIADTISGLLGEELRMVRFEDDEAVFVSGSVGPHQDVFPVGSRLPLGGNNALSHVARTGESARIDDYSQASGSIAEVVRPSGLRSAVATPIVVHGRLWGAMLVGVFGEEPLPLDAERRIRQFTDLMETAIANTEARAEIERLAEEQAALRRVATLVAEGAPPEQVFWAVIEQVRGVLGCDAASLLRYHEDYSRTELADTDFELVGERAPLGGHNAATLVYEAGRPVRIDDYAQDATGPSAAHAHHSGWRSCVAVPLSVEGRLWGVVMAASKTEKPLAADAEERLAKFTELIATAISNTDARDGLRELADEQAALRRVATLVAASAAPSDVFAAVTEEIALVLGADATLLCRADPDGAAVVVGSWGDATPRPGTRIPQGGANLTTIVLDTGRPARIESYADATGDASEVARSHGLRTAVGAPILVEGRLWGLVIAGTTTDEPLPQKAEERLAGFTELVATAISNAEARGSEHRLAGEQAALRRVATLVARGVPPATLFSAVSKEIARVFGGAEPALLASLIRFDPGPECVLVAASRPYEQEPVGSRWKPKELYVSTQVLRTGASARVDEADLDEAGGPDADILRLRGFLCQVGTPIVVEDRVWGAMTLNSNEALPPDTDERLARFTELIATAIANAESRNAIARLADEQAALRRVATLVARDAPSTEVFEAVAMEVGKLLDTDITIVGRYNGDGTATAIGNYSVDLGGVPVGTRSTLGGRNVLTMVAETGKSARMDGYDDASGDAAEIARRHAWRSSIAAPIAVEDRVWGVMLVATQRPEPFPAGAEERLEKFTELVATAIANAESRAEVERLANEQAALRRVATLVAQGAPHSQVFAAVAREASTVSELSIIEIARFDPDGFQTVVGSAGEHPLQTGTRWPLDNPHATGIQETGRITKFELTEDLPGLAVQALRASGVRWAVGVPIVVDGKVWGTIGAAVPDGGPLPADAEARLVGFCELVATTISNASTHSELLASRARIVAAGDEARRRIERNLHDGTQQRLIALGLDIAALRASVPDGQGDLDTNLERLEGEVEEVLGEVRELSRGLHPGLLSRQGLGPSLRALARRNPLPVSLEVDLKERLPEPVETATYFVVSEAMTNAVKHGQASYLTVSVGVDESHLRATIADDGVGGAEPGAGSGSGLIGLADRVNALGGRFVLESPPGRGTTISIELPLTA